MLPYSIGGAIESKDLGLRLRGEAVSDPDPRARSERTQRSKTGSLAGLGITEVNWRRGLCAWNEGVAPRGLLRNHF